MEPLLGAVAHGWGSSLWAPGAPSWVLRLVGCLVVWLASWLVGGFPGCCVCWLVGWLAGWLVGWLVGWMVGWLDGWMVGWLVCFFANTQPTNQPNNNTTKQPTTQPTNQTTVHNQPLHTRPLHTQPLHKKPTNQPTNQPASQPAKPAKPAKPAGHDHQQRAPQNPEGVGPTATLSVLKTSGKSGSSCSGKPPLLGPACFRQSHEPLVSRIGDESLNTLQWHPSALSQNSSRDCASTRPEASLYLQSFRCHMEDNLFGRIPQKYSSDGVLCSWQMPSRSKSFLQFPGASRRVRLRPNGSTEPALRFRTRWKVATNLSRTPSRSLFQTLTRTTR